VIIGNSDTKMFQKATLQLTRAERKFVILKIALRKKLTKNSNYGESGELFYVKVECKSGYALFWRQNYRVSFNWRFEWTNVLVKRFVPQFKRGRCGCC